MAPPSGARRLINHPAPKKEEKEEDNGIADLLEF